MSRISLRAVFSVLRLLSVIVGEVGRRARAPPTPTTPTLRLLLWLGAARISYWLILSAGRGRVPATKFSRWVPPGVSFLPSHLVGKINLLREGLKRPAKVVPVKRVDAGDVP